MHYMWYKGIPGAPSSLTDGRNALPELVMVCGTLVSLPAAESGLSKILMPYGTLMCTYTVRMIAVIANHENTVQ